MAQLKLKNNLYRTKSYWLIKKWFEDKPVFLFWKNAFYGYKNLNDAKTSFHLLLPTLPAFIRTVVYSTIIIFILELCNIVLPTNLLFDKNAIDTLLAAIASITGVFLGLYFTAISSIASNFLVRATQDIRRLFLSAPKGQQYVRTIALTGIITIFYIVAKSLGHTIHPVGLVFLALLAAYVIIGFWSVGSDVFNSLEPKNSFPWVTKCIADSIKKIKPSGFQWKKPAIQNHHRGLVTYNLELLNNLIRFGIKEIKLSDEQLRVALKYLGGILSFYSDNKSKIPSNSYWYKTKNQHESWMLADSIQVSLALNTGTTIQPKTIKDFTWFEEQVLDISVSVLKFFADEKKIGSIFEGFEIFVNVAEIYGKDFDELSIKLLFEKFEKVNNSIDLIKSDDSSKIADKEKLALIDSQGRLATAAMLGLTKYLDKQSSDNLDAIISSIDWTSDDESIYLTGLPLAVLPRLEAMSSEFKNELIIEKKIVSPQWYIKTLCIQKYLFSLQSYFNFIKTLHLDYFQPKFEKLLTDEQFPLAVQIIQRWLEFSSKYIDLVRILRKHVENCKDFRQVKDLPWPEFDFTEEEKTALDREKEVTDKMVNLLPRLKTVVGDDLPDYFGQALTMGVQACYDASENNDHERLKNIFPVVFDASLAAHDLTRQKVQNWSQEENKLIYSTEPLINLFELSGYIKLYSELYQNNELWDVAKKLWDIYLDGAVNTKQIIEFIAAIVGYRSTLFMMMPQANLRSNWQITFGQKMREQGLPTFPYDRDYTDSRRQLNHVSPIIRVLSKSSSLIGLYMAQNIFFATYLSNKPEAIGVDFPDKRDLKERIEQEQQGNNNENEDDE